MEAPLLVCEGLSLSYDGVRDAVHDVSFSVRAGSIFALVGPNGAGKTSTLRMLATLGEPAAGRITIDGVDAVRTPELARARIGYLPDHFALYDAMTPVDYLTFFARCHGVDERVREARIESLLTEFELDGKRDAAIRSLSRGMRQRLGVAKTLVHEPKLLLLDEPASALDPSARARLRETLGRLKKRGLAIVVSSHILPDLAELADAVGIMEGGRMIRTGAIEQVAREVQRAGMSYRVDVRANVDRAERALGEFGPRLRGFQVVPAPAEVGVRIEVELEGGEEAVADLVEALVLRGVRVSHVAARESALESLYHASATGAVA